MWRHAIIFLRIVDLMYENLLVPAWLLSINLALQLCYDLMDGRTVR